MCEKKTKKIKMICYGGRITSSNSFDTLLLEGEMEVSLPGQAPQSTQIDVYECVYIYIYISQFESRDG